MIGKMIGKYILKKSKHHGKRKARLNIIIKRHIKYHKIR